MSGICQLLQNKCSAASMLPMQTRTHMTRDARASLCLACLWTGPCGTFPASAAIGASSLQLAPADTALTLCAPAPGDDLLTLAAPAPPLAGTLLETEL